MADRSTSAPHKTARPVSSTSSRLTGAAGLTRCWPSSALLVGSGRVVSRHGETLVFSGNTQVAMRNDIFKVRVRAKNSRHEVLLQTPSTRRCGRRSRPIATRWPMGRMRPASAGSICARFPVLAPAATASYPMGTETVPCGDGRELFYHTADSVMVVPVQTGETFRRGAPRRLFSIRPYIMGGFYNWDVTRDGKRFLIVKREGSADSDPPPPQLIVTLNWPYGAETPRADELNVSCLPGSCRPELQFSGLLPCGRACVEEPRFGPPSPWRSVREEALPPRL